MIQSVCRHPLVMVVTIALLPLAAKGQFEPPPMLSASGTSKIECKPTLMRLDIQIVAKVKGLKNALDKLTKQRDSAKAAVLKLGAIEDSIKLTATAIGTGASEEQRQMEMMVRRQMMRKRGAAKEDEKKKEDVPITLNTSLTADWTLKGASPEEILLQVHELQEKIKEADLSGLKKAAEEMSEEDEELMEEMEEEMHEYRYVSDNQPKPGEPMFIFVGKLSDADRSKALTEAFAKAKKSAQQLAKAAGVTLGPLRRLTSNMQPQYDELSSAQRYLYRYMQRTPWDMSGNLEEIVGTGPGPITTNITVSTSFAIK